MKRILLVWHSQGGRTGRLAEAVAAGLAQAADEITVCNRQALQASTTELLEADGILIGTAEQFGYMSGAIKDFFDRTYYPAEGKMQGRPYGLFVCADNDGQGAIVNVERIATGYGWKRALPPMLVKGEPTPEQLNAAEEWGATFAAGLSIGLF